MTEDAVVSTRGHFEPAPGRPRLTPGRTRTEFDVLGAVPGFGSPAPDELVVFVHGWQNDETDASDAFEQAREGFRVAGYDHPVVGYSWDADTSLLAWHAATKIARANGRKLAAFVRSYSRNAPGTTVRLVAHSLGAAVALEAVLALDRWGEPLRTPSLTLLGAAVPASSVGDGERYFDAIRRTTRSTDNFWLARDTILSVAYSMVAFDRALGLTGAVGATPDNYRDHAAGAFNHYAYYHPGDGCLDAVVARWER